jgi:membrane-associated PAP2 superfamily phosphatase
MTAPQRDWTSTSGRRRFWSRHLLLPVMLLGAAAVASMALDWDHAIAQKLFFDTSAGRFIGAGTGAWWARDLLHEGGRNLVRAIGMAALVVWIGSLWLRGWAPLRRPAAYVALCLITSATVVAALKLATNTDCPRDLLVFGGLYPDVGFFDPRPADLPRALCFPGAHACSGYSLLAFYYAAASHRSRYDWRWLLPALLTGTAFAFAQEARGAHFLSHDLVGAAVAVCVAAAFAALLLRLPEAG